MSDEQGVIAIDTSPGDDFASQPSDSETTSLRSSITEYVYENGRRYHAYHAGEYWGSNDEKSMGAMDILHHVYALMMDGKLHLAPIPPDPKRVLDIGTGTGKWAVDFGDMYPSARVIGTDLSPIQPSFVPPNVSFEIDDCCDEWLFPQPFDLIHIRGLFGSVADWDKLYNQALQHLQPGGYIEQLETTMLLRSDDGSADNTVMRQFQQLGLESSAKFGKSLNTAEEMKAGIIKAGFVDVTEHSFKLPVGPWPRERQLKTLGRYQRLVWEESIEMWSMMLLTKVLGWSRENVDAYLMQVRKDLRNPDIHSYQDVRVCYGRKPTAEESAQETG